MKTPENINDLAKKLAGFMPNSLHDLQSDVEQNIKSGLEGGLRKMNLISREEFDVQNAVLLRTREKLEKLEAQLTAVEAQLSEVLEKKP